MPDLSGLLSQSPNLIIYLSVAAAVMLAIEGLGLSLARLRSYRGRINKRLRLLDENGDHQDGAHGDPHQRMRFK